MKTSDTTEHHHTTEQAHHPPNPSEQDPSSYWRRAARGSWGSACAVLLFICVTRCKPPDFMLKPSWRHYYQCCQQKRWYRRRMVRGAELEYRGAWLESHIYLHLRLQNKNMVTVYWHCGIPWIKELFVGSFCTKYDTLLRFFSRRVQSLN